MLDGAVMYTMGVALLARCDYLDDQRNDTLMSFDVESLQFVLAKQTYRARRKSRLSW